MWKGLSRKLSVPHAKHIASGGDEKKNFSVMSWRKEKAFIIWAVQCTESQGANGTGEQKVANYQVPTFINNEAVFYSTAIKLHFKWL